MSYMKQEQANDDGFAKLIIKHSSIIRQNYIVIFALTVLGLTAGIVVQQLSSDSFIKEVLLRNGNGAHLRIISNLIQPTSIFMDGSIKPIDQAGLKLTSRNSSEPGPSTSLTVQNYTPNRIEFGTEPQKIKAINPQIILRVANSKDVKIAAINSLPDDSRLKRIGSRSEEDMKKVIKRYKISNLKRGSKEIIIRYTGKSIEEADIAVNALLAILSKKFIQLARTRMKNALEAKKQIINSQISDRKFILQQYAEARLNDLSPAQIKKLIAGDMLMIALSSDLRKISSFPVESFKIESFNIIPIELSKKDSFIKSNTWLFLITIAGLLIGILIAYLIYGFRRLKQFG